jgi:hypothetical protein
MRSKGRRRVYLTDMRRRGKRRQAVESLNKNNIAPRANKPDLNYSCNTPKFFSGVALSHQVFGCN